jgi:hypothetical protein
VKKILLAGVAALSVLSASAAHATQIWCAVVMKPSPEVVRDKEYNPDGWLALREKPNRRSPMVITLSEGDYLTIGSEQCWKGVCDTDEREWVHVAGVSRIDDKGGSITFGWVRRKYVQEFTCPEDQEAQAPKPEPEREPALGYLRPEDLPSLPPPEIQTYNPGQLVCEQIRGTNSVDCRWKQPEPDPGVTSFPAILGTPKPNCYPAWTGLNRC